MVGANMKGANSLSKTFGKDRNRSHRLIHSSIDRVLPARTLEKWNPKQAAAVATSNQQLQQQQCSIN
ncbi:hypothetical protein M0804_008621 [Polistes exclamans]|nr:hypothetical protein M0804_008621 [Polistes exclamans]